MYTKPIGEIVARHHCYAVDIDIPDDESIVAALAKVELCDSEVAAWQTNKKVKT